MTQLFEGQTGWHRQDVSAAAAVGNVGGRIGAWRSGDLTERPSAADTLAAK